MGMSLLDIFDYAKKISNEFYASFRHIDGKPKWLGLQRPAGGVGINGSETQKRSINCVGNSKIDIFVRRFFYSKEISLITSKVNYIQMYSKHIKDAMNFYEKFLELSNRPNDLYNNGSIESSLIASKVNCMRMYNNHLKEAVNFYEKFREVSNRLNDLYKNGSIESVVDKISKMSHFEIDSRHTNEDVLSFKSVSPIILRWKRKKSRTDRSVDLGYIGFSISFDNKNSRMFKAYPAGDNITVAGLFHPNIDHLGNVCLGRDPEELTKAIVELDILTVDRIMYQLLTTYNDEAPYADFSFFEKERESMPFKDRIRRVAVFVDVEGSTDPRFSNKSIFDKINSSSTGDFAAEIEDKYGFAISSVSVQKTINNHLRYLEISYPSVKADGSIVESDEFFGFKPTFVYLIDKLKTGDTIRSDLDELTETFVHYIANELSINRDKTDFFTLVKPHFLWPDLYQRLRKQSLIEESKDSVGNIKSDWLFL